MNIITRIAIDERRRYIKYWITEAHNARTDPTGSSYYLRSVQLHRTHPFGERELEIDMQSIPTILDGELRELYDTIATAKLTQPLRTPDGSSRFVAKMARERIHTNVLYTIRREIARRCMIHDDCAPFVKLSRRCKLRRNARDRYARIVGPRINRIVFALRNFVAVSHAAKIEERSSIRAITGACPKDSAHAWRIR